MRAVLLTSAFILACGGRSIGDPIFDEQPGDGGNRSGGGKAGGGPSGKSGSTGARTGTGGTLATGGRTGGGRSRGGSANGGFVSFGGSTGFGGKASFGGSVGLGGKASFSGSIGFGGKASFGGSVSLGGKLSFGGQVGFGGASAGVPATGGSGGGPSSSTQKACARFCTTLFKACPDQLGGSREDCAVNCIADLSNTSSECEVAKRDAINCVSKAISGSGSNCQALPLALIPCAPALARAQACEPAVPPPDPGCMSFSKAGPGFCGVVEQCGDTRYVTTCTALSSVMGVNCTCEVNGVTVSESFKSGAVDDVCAWAMSVPCGPN